MKCRAKSKFSMQNITLSIYLHKTNHILVHLIHPDSLSLHHKRGLREHILSSHDRVWNQCDTSGGWQTLLEELNLDSRLRLIHRGSESDRHKPDSLRRSCDGPCSENHLPESFQRLILRAKCSNKSSQILHLL